MTCSIDGCTRAAFCRGWCNMHYQRWYRLGDPLLSRPPGGQIGHAPSAKRYPTVTYSGAHQRLRRDVGRADAHSCACGCGRYAQDWAYKGKVGFSTDPADYQPMHRSCHRLFDKIG